MKNKTILMLTCLAIIGFGTACEVEQESVPAKIKKQMPILENITTMPHADGEVGFYQACRRNKPGSLCKPVFININGDEISGAEAHNGYMKYHQLKFGALTIATATALIDVSDLEVRSIVAFGVEKPTVIHLPHQVSRA